jgi:PTH1 family peptidyl-tRNA hydrolase
VKLVVGLGNPGPRYRHTRHNAGFRVLDVVAARAAAGSPESRFAGRYVEVAVAGQRVGLLAPETFMNRSGEALALALAALPIADPALDLLVVFDDADLPLGRLRLRARGSSGGHNGLADVLERLATAAVPRLRFGIGRPGAPQGTVDYVLEPFAPAEETLLAEALPRAADAVTCFVAEGIAAAMNRFNGPWPVDQVPAGQARPASAR